MLILSMLKNIPEIFCGKNHLASKPIFLINYAEKDLLAVKWLGIKGNLFVCLNLTTFMDYSLDSNSYLSVPVM